LVRTTCPDQPILVPGIGAQGGAIEAAVAAGGAADPANLILAVSRQVLYASSASDWERAARASAEQLRRQIAEAARLDD
jgi:orotidine-5'-phosphate decarboxylase